MNIRALQLGPIDYSRRFELTLDTDWNYEPELNMADTEYDFALIDRVLTDREADILTRIVRAYSLFILDDIVLTDRMEYLMRSRCGQKITKDELPSFLEKQFPNYFGRPYGEKYDPHTIEITPGFRGHVHWNGFTETVMEGDFGDHMKQALYWRGNIPVEAGQAIDFWLEYETNGDIEIELQIVQFISGSVASIQRIWTFDEESLRHPVTIENKKKDGPVFVSLNAKGKGTLRILALHDRYSRRGVGSFLPGGRRFVSGNREEIFAYLDPGDFKPPLCVYFSGYKTMEGFEGYHMMRRMGTPFLLISEARLEGGDFYLGDEEYETCLKNVIEKAMHELSFTPDQVILSGLSMGTFGALYYGSMIRPGNILVGKPLVNLGSMAKAERIERPGGFPTSLDVLWKQYRRLDQTAVDQMNQHFWDTFDRTDWTGRSFYIAYMIEDDYDAAAYQDLLSHMQGKGAKVIGKGLHGRHNDETSGIVTWFLRQYRRVLRDEFGRNQA